MAQTIATAEPSVYPAALFLAARVAEVDGGPGFCASVLIDPRLSAPVVRLDASIRGTAHEGRVFRWAMETLAAGQPDYYDYGDCGASPAESPDR